MSPQVGAYTRALKSEKSLVTLCPVGGVTNDWWVHKLGGVSKIAGFSYQMRPETQVLHGYDLSCLRNVKPYYNKNINNNNCKRPKSRVMRKPTFCICENKDADQLRGNREADQRLCFRYTDSTIPLLPKSKISSL